MRPFIATSLIPLGLIAAFLAGCASGPPSGSWIIEPEGQALFESGTVLPDHTYYYLGSFTAPDSIIAIDHRFTLRTRVWAQVDMTASRLNGWLQWYRTDQHPPGCAYRGGVILTPDGQRAGFWYSPNPINIVYLPEPGVIEVYQPQTASGRVCGQDGYDSMFPGGK
ncbi:MAG: hypothetical protein FWD79_11815 [Desulfobulbus sp.]|nr:hypothetical protein [Desulfobulbus sp.]